MIGLVFYLYQYTLVIHLPLLIKECETFLFVLNRHDIIYNVIHCEWYVRLSLKFNTDT